MSENRESMIERVARAICRLKHDDPDTRMPTSINPPDGRPVWTAYEQHARAAIEAMREPTQKIEDAGYAEIIAEESVNYIWKTMIDAALGD